MNLALIAGGDEQVAFAVEGHGPDVLWLGIVEDLRLAVAGDAVDLAVGRSGGIDPIFGIDRDGVDLQAVEFGQHFAFAVGRNAEELGAGAAAGVQVAFGIVRQRPQIGGGGIEQLVELGRQGEQCRRCAARGS